MKKSNRGSRQYSFRRKVVTLAVASCFVAEFAHANPTGPTVISGQVSFGGSGNSLQITNSPGSIINWQGFSIGANEITRFLQQSASSAVLNRVTGLSPSVIQGVLQSNGRVFLINSNGVTFGAGATIDTAGLVASSLKMSDGDFLAGRMKFTDGAGAGNVANQGNITTSSGGSVYLIAPNIQNSGIIRSDGGEVILAAGKSVDIVNAGAPDLRVTITAPDNQAVNVGQIIGGRIGIYGGLIRQGGVVNANTAVRGENGKIVFKATKDVTLEAGSSTTASGPTGGSISIQSDSGKATIAGVVEANGTQGKGGTIAVAAPQGVVVETSGRVTANGTEGGSVSLVSSAGSVAVSGTVTANAISGNAGAVALTAATTASLASTGRVTASGGQGGGAVSIKGSNSVTFDPGSTVSASGASGGTVTVQADQGAVVAQGTIDASASDGVGGNVQIAALSDITLDVGSQIFVGGTSGGEAKIESTDGTLLAAGLIDGQGNRGPGGLVWLLAPRVGLLREAVVDVSGLNGGGTILVGGDNHGANPDIQNALFTDVASGALLRADALENGNGGRVIVWSDDTTKFLGRISARGGTESGNGGFAEVSGKKNLTVGGFADLRATNGNFGNLLLDPGQVNICAFGVCGTQSGPVNTFSDDYLSTQLGLGGVSILTSAATGANGANEDIIFQDPTISISWSANTTLTLTAGRNITLNGSISGSGATSGIAMNFGQTSAGILDMSGATALSANTITMTGGASSDTIVGRNIVNTWSVTGANSGTLNGNSFSTVENLTGGSNSDGFTVSGTGHISGTITGGGGTDTLTGNNIASTWAINAANAGTLTDVNGANAFTGIQNVSGGSNSDGFTLSGTGHISGTITGGGGTDTLTGNNIASTWAINAANAGTLTDANGANAFTGIQNVSGGSNTDGFTLSGTGNISGTITGGGGTNTLTGNDIANTWAINAANAGTLTDANGANAFTGIQNVTGGSNTDGFTLSATGNISGTIDGGGGTNTLTGNNLASTWAINTANTGTLTDANGGNAFTGIQNLSGGSADDTFTFGATGSLGGLINGGGQAVADTVSYAAFVGALTVTIGAGSSITNIETVTGNANATLVGPNLANTWNITNNDAGSVAGVNFTSFKNLTGNANTDNFVFTDAKSISGVIDGAGGTNTLNWAAYTTGRSVTLTAVGATVGFDGSEASVVGGFKNITDLTGAGTGSNTLTGLNAGATWNVTGANSGNYVSTNTLNFGTFQNVTGGSNSDGFTVSGTGHISGTITGGGGTDTLTGNNIASTWAINAANAGTLTDVNGANAFTGIQNVSGGSNSDGFTLSGTGHISGTITGGGGTDTLTGNNIASTWAINAANAGTLTDANGANAFTGIQNVSGGSNTDGFTLSGTGNISGTITGGGGTNTLTGNDIANTWAINAANAGTLTDANGANAFTGIQNVTGGSNTDGFTLSATGNISGTIDGGGGTNTLTGNNLASTWAINTANTGTLTDANGGNAFTGIQNLSGGSADDTFTFGATGSLGGLINGGGQAVADTVSYAAFVGALTVTIGAGSSITNIETVTGNANATLVGPNLANTWNITNNDAGSVAGVNFTSFKNLTGNANTDNFVFTDAKSISGVIDGAGGTNTLNWAAYTTGRSVTLTAVGATVGFDGSEASVVGGFKNITDLTGAGTGSNTLTGLNAGATWNVTGANSGNYVSTNTLNFGTFQNVTGGSNSDGFTVSGTGHISGTITGGGGTDTLTGNNIASTWAINAANAGTLTDVNGANAFTGIQNVSGGSNSDGFTLSGTGHISGTITGGGGTDTLTGNNIASTWAINAANAGTLTDANGANAFTGIQNVSGGSNTDGFTLSGTGNISGTITGGGGTNTLTGNDIANTWAINAANAGTLTDANGANAFTGIQNVTGGSNTDGFTLSATGNISGTIDGGGGTNTLTGNNLASTWAINTANTGTLTDANGGNAFTGIQNLSGGSADDTFTFGATGSLGGLINGGGQAVADTVSYAAFVGALTVTIGAGSSITNIETVTGNANATLVGPNLANTWNITNNDAGSVAGVNFTSFKNLTGNANTDSFTFGGTGHISGTITGGGGTDTLTGNNIASTWAINAANAGTLTDANGANAFTGIQNVSGGSNTDGFTLSGTGNISGTITGGGGANTLTGNSIANTWAINAANAGTLTDANGANAFTGIQNLAGGSNTDGFTLSGTGDISGTITGGGGTNTLTGNNIASAWAINAANAGSVTDANGANAFTGIQNVTGGSNTDGFTLSGTGNISGTIDGGGGTNTLTGNNLASTWAINTANAGTVTDANGANAFTGIQNVTGGGNTDAFMINFGGSLAGTIDGGAGANTLTLNGSAGNDTFTITAAAITGVAAYTNVNSITIDGTGGGNDNYNIQGLAAGTPLTINAGGGNDSFVLNSNAPATTGNLDAIASNVTLNAGLGVNSLIVSDFSSATANAAVAITGGSITGMAGPTDAQIISYTGNFATFNVQGSNSSGDVMTVSSLPGGIAALTINGNGGVDTLNINTNISTAGAQTLTADTINLNGNLSTTGGGFDIALTGAVSLLTNITLDGGAGGNVNVAGALAGGGNNLTVNSGQTTTFGGNVSGVVALATNAGGSTVINGTINSGSLNFGDTSALNGGSITTTAGNQIYGGAVTLGANTSMNSSGSNIQFNSAVDGAQNLTLTAGAGLITFNGAVGSSTPIGTGAGAALTINSGVTTFNSTLATASGLSVVPNITFKDNVTIGAGNTATNFDGDVTFNRAVGTLTFQAGRTVDFGNTGADQITLSTNAVNISTTANNGNLNFNGKVDGAQDLTLATNGAGTINFGAAVGSVTPIGDGTGAAITITNGSTTFNSTLVSASGLSVTPNITFKDNVTIGTGNTATNFDGDVTFNRAAGTLTFLAGRTVAFGNTGADQVTLSTNAVNISTTANNGNLNFNGKVDGAQDLTLATNGAGTINFAAAVGSATPIGDGTGAAITITNGSTTFNSTLVSASGLSIVPNITFKDNVTIGAGNTATNLDGDVTFNRAAGTLTFQAGRTIDFGNTGADQITLSTNAVNISTTANNGNLNFNGKVDGAQDLTLATNGAGTINFAAAVGSATPIGDGTGAALTINSGVTTFNSTLATASGLSVVPNITFKDNVTIGAGNTATNFDGDVTFNRAVGTLTFQAGRTVDFGNTGADQITLSTNAVNISTTANNGNLNFNGKVDGAQDLTLATNGAGTINFGAAVGSVTPIGDGTGAAITITNGSTTFNSTLVSASGLSVTPNITFKDNVTIGTGNTATNFDGDVTFNRAAGTLTFLAGRTVAFGNTGADQVTLSTNAVNISTTANNGNLNFNGKVDGAQNLTLATNGTGSILFGAAAGSVARLGNVVINAANNVDLNGTFSAASLKQNAGTGTTTTTGNVNTNTAAGVQIVGNNITVGAGGITTSAGGVVTFNNTGTLTINGQINSDGDVTQVGAGGTILASDIFTNQNLVQFSQAVTLAGGNRTIDTTAPGAVLGTIQFNGAINGAGFGLTLKAPVATGDIVFNQSATNLTNLTVTSAKTFTIAAGKDIAASAGVSLAADNMFLNGTIHAGSAAVNLTSASAGQTITVGAGGSGLGLSIGELNNISTTGPLTIGTAGHTSPIQIDGNGTLNSTTTSLLKLVNGGDIAVDAVLQVPVNAQLAAGGKITDSFGTGQLTVTGGNNLNLLASNGIGTTTNPLRTDTASLTLDNTTANDVYVQNSGAVTLATIFRNQGGGGQLWLETLNGAINTGAVPVSTNNGQMILTASDTSGGTNNAQINIGSGGLTSGGGKIALHGADVITIQGGITTGGGDVEIISGTGAGLSNGAITLFANETTADDFGAIFIGAPINTGSGNTLLVASTTAAPSIIAGVVQGNSSGNIIGTSPVVSSINPSTGLAITTNGPITTNILTVVTLRGGGGAGQGGAAIDLQNATGPTNTSAQINLFACPVIGCPDTPIPGVTRTTGPFMTGGITTAPMIVNTPAPNASTPGKYADGPIFYVDSGGTAVSGVGTVNDFTFYTPGSVTINTIQQARNLKLEASGDIDISLTAPVDNTVILKNGSLQLVAGNNIRYNPASAGNTFGAPSPVNFTANPGTDVFTSPVPHGLSNGSVVILATTGSLPAGINPGQTYYVVNATATTFELSATSGGPAIDITTAGSNSFIPRTFDRNLMFTAAGSIDINNAIYQGNDVTGTPIVTTLVIKANQDVSMNNGAVNIGRLNPTYNTASGIGDVTFRGNNEVSNLGGITVEGVNINVLGGNTSGANQSSVGENIKSAGTINFNATFTPASPPVKTGNINLIASAAVLGVSDSAAIVNGGNVNIGMATLRANDLVLTGGSNTVNGLGSHASDASILSAGQINILLAGNATLTGGNATASGALSTETSTALANIKGGGVAFDALGNVTIVAGTANADSGASAASTDYGADASASIISGGAFAPKIGGNLTMSGKNATAAASAAAPVVRAKAQSLIQGDSLDITVGGNLSQDNSLALATANVGTGTTAEASSSALLSSNGNKMLMVGGNWNVIGGTAGMNNATVIGVSGGKADTIAGTDAGSGFATLTAAVTGNTNFTAGSESGGSTATAAAALLASGEIKLTTAALVLTGNSASGLFRALTVSPLTVQRVDGKFPPVTINGNGSGITIIQNAALGSALVLSGAPPSNLDSLQAGIISALQSTAANRILGFDNDVNNAKNKPTDSNKVCK